MIRTEVKRERQREGAEGLGTFGAWVEAQTRDDSRHRRVKTGSGDERTGTGTRERRNTNRLDVDDGVGVGSDMAEASHLPEVAKEMKYPQSGRPPPESFCRSSSLPLTSAFPPEPTFLVRISRVLFLWNVARMTMMKTVVMVGKERHEMK